jgi:uncharacterized protein YxjI
MVAVMATNASVLSRSTLVVEQKTKLFELRNEYGIFDEAGARIGSVTQVGQGLVTLLARIGTEWDWTLPVKLEIREDDGTPLLLLHKPWFRMTVHVAGRGGAPLGSIRKKIRVGKARFVLEDASGDEVGEVRAQNWRAKDFAVNDPNGQPVAQVGKKWRGLAREVFTDADTYVVQLQPHATDPVRSLALSAALAIDIVMKQKDYS